MVSASTPCPCRKIGDFADVALRADPGTALCRQRLKCFLRNNFDHFLIGRIIARRRGSHECSGRGRKTPFPTSDSMAMLTRARDFFEACWFSPMKIMMLHVLQDDRSR
jgi:hypothetical protein